MLQYCFTEPLETEMQPMVLMQYDGVQWAQLQPGTRQSERLRLGDGLEAIVGTVEGKRGGGGVVEGVQVFMSERHCV